MKSVVTVLGNDRIGIIAEITKVFYECQVNIDNINQAILDDLFTMVMVVNMKDMTLPFETLQERLSSVSTRLGVDIRIQKYEIFQNMHSI